MLVLFTGKSRASCRFLHSMRPSPEKCGRANLLTDLEGLTKSCVFSGLEQCARLRARGNLRDPLCPETGLAPLTIGAEPS